jgi:hypothetical protein
MSSSPVEIKSNNHEHAMELVKKYWWVLALLIVAFLVYRYQKRSKEDSADKPAKTA